MSNFSLRLPDHILNEAKNMAATNHVSLNQFFLAVISEKLGELKTQQFFSQRSKNANQQTALDLLKKAGTEKIEGDELSE